MDAIIQIESRGIETARNGQYLGVLQIAPVLVRECNDIMRSRGDSRRFTLNDRLSRQKSKEMFVTIMSKYNPENDNFVSDIFERADKEMYEDKKKRHSLADGAAG